MPFISSWISADAAGSAANAQTKAADKSGALAKEIYQSQRADFAPFREAGVSNLNRLENVLEQPGAAYAPVNIDTAALRETPGYQFQMDEGRRAIEGSRASAGLLRSGQTGKELMTFGQGIADQNFQQERAYQTRERDTALDQANLLRANQVNALQNLVSTGSGATANTAQAGSNYGAAAGNALMAAGEAKAAGALGRANAITKGIGDTMNLGAKIFGFNL
jgi:hypothetical protein